MEEEKKEEEERTTASMTNMCCNNFNGKCCRNSPSVVRTIPRFNWGDDLWVLYELRVLYPTLVLQWEDMKHQVVNCRRISLLSC